MPLFRRRGPRDDRGMLQKQPGRIRPLRPLIRFLAGIHAAHGLAHGLRPAPDSPARAD